MKIQETFCSHYIFSSILTFLMNARISLQAWPTQQPIWASDEKTTNHCAHTWLLGEGLKLHMRILTLTHAQWRASQSVHPHRWSLHFAIPLSLVHSKHADAVFINLLAILVIQSAKKTAHVSKSTTSQTTDRHESHLPPTKTLVLLFMTLTVCGIAICLYTHPISCLSISMVVGCC